jgi:hypothetical protein
VIDGYTFGSVEVALIINLALASIMFVVMVAVLRRVPSVRGFAIAMLLIALVSIIFYVVVLLTTLNRLSPDLADLLSGMRSAFIYTILIGIGITWLKLYGKMPNE